MLNYSDLIVVKARDLAKGLQQHLLQVKQRVVFAEDVVVVENKGVFVCTSQKTNFSVVRHDIVLFITYKSEN